jgi:2,3-bisphosphoglycerate-independent phosphoglycerate mutase
MGGEDPEVNPFVRARMPVLENLLGSKKLAGEVGVINNENAYAVLLDASMGVDGLPQSATGQASLVTGTNVPGAIGYHYGPKPNPDVAAIIREANIFKSLTAIKKRVGLLNAYPKGYFDSIASGRRIYSAIPLAVTTSGTSLKTETDYYSEMAISADLTGEGWRDHLGYSDAPIYSEVRAGKLLSRLAKEYDFSFFEFWLTDVLGHRQEMQNAVDVLEMFDRVLGGLLAEWDTDLGLILITSDHGNLEDLSTRRHTTNLVPAIFIGSPELRKPFENALLKNLSDITPAIETVFS